MAKTLVIDAGHGGSDPGACANGRKEAELNWEFATALAVRARVAGLTAFVVPHTDATTKGLPRLKNRVKEAVAKKADWFISIHWNSAANPNARGCEAWYATGDGESSALADAVVDAVAKTMQTPDRGSKPDGENRHGRLGVLHGHLKKTKKILLELGFVSNEQDLKNAAAKKTAIVDAIIKVLA